MSNFKLVMLLLFTIICTGFIQPDNSNDDRWPIEGTTKELKFCSDMEWRAASNNIILDCDYFAGAFKINIPDTNMARRYSDYILYSLILFSEVIIRNNMPNKYDWVYMSYNYEADKQIMIKFDSLYKCTADLNANKNADEYRYCIISNSFRRLSR